MKYEEIYPPRLNDIMYVFSNTFLSNKAVVLAEVAILKNVNFVIHMEYPTTILNKKVNIPEDKRAEILYNLEIALNNEEISKNYEWSIIVEAIVFMMSPLTERLDKKRKDQDKILKVNKKLILEKDNIDVNSWLYKKHKNFGKYYVV